MAVVGGQVERREVHQRQCEPDVADRDQRSDGNALDEPHDHRRHQDDDKGTRTEHEASVGGRIAIQRLEQLRHERRAAKQHDPQQEIEACCECEIAVLEKSHLDYRIVVMEFPDDRSPKRSEGDDKKRRNERALEPVLVLTAIEHHLQASESDGDQRNADVVNPQPPSLARLSDFRHERRWVRHETVGEEQ